MAVVAGPVLAGGITKVTPSFFIRSYSWRMSSTWKMFAGMPESWIAFWYVLAAGFSFGSRRSSTSAGPSGETTVSHR